MSLEAFTRGDGTGGPYGWEQRGPSYGVILDVERRRSCNRAPVMATTMWRITGLKVPLKGITAQLSAFFFSQRQCLQLLWHVLHLCGPSRS